ncbi:hypothetical protein FHR24_000041 [Wenyingzhuangia heitensis]|uniref:Peptidase M43 pregnancy-associated plasma-A domain-containing protein n=1 Tax=Wenyingzhuangia heitensis TaxID=1487859 RepID=A0ABX0U472_9FLAO|nr:M43 family zinc metalloprotease [Wenyingzhuangia heitensis]NIJ43602.1 hypothetical protein [Wenyingzhuangia heitensis]
MKFINTKKVKFLKATINKTTVLLIVAFMFGTSLFSQDNTNPTKITKANTRAKDVTGFVRCFTVEYEKKQSEEYTNKSSEVAFESWMLSKKQQLNANRSMAKLTAETYNIPVVVHVVHNGDPINTIGNIVGENISDAQVQSQINVLNQDYRRMQGTPGGSNSTGVAVDVGINFYLAKQDLDGLETSGIIRHNITPYTNNVYNNSEGADWETYEDLQLMKTTTQWDPTQYLNIWVVKMGGKNVEDEGLEGVLGFAQFPSDSNLDGLDVNGGDALTDGVVIAYHAFGDITKDDGSFNLNTLYNQGRTTTHEIGHWLGLRHIWGDTDTCGNGDYCLDTPDATEEHYSCEEVYDTCLSDNLGNDMVQNYMDYTNDSCMDTFTEDQKQRMLTVLKNSPRRVELLSSMVADVPLYSNEELAGFVVETDPVFNTTLVSGLANGVVKISLFDNYGRLIVYKEHVDDGVVFTEELDLSKLAPNIYILLIEQEGKRIVKRIIKE